MKVIQRPVKTLQTALLSDSKDLIKLYRKYTDQERQLLEEGFKAGQQGCLFQLITVHSDSDWIPAHPEEPQDFRSFWRDPHRTSPDPAHNTIYIQTIGEYVCVWCGHLSSLTTLIIMSVTLI